MLHTNKTQSEFIRGPESSKTLSEPETLQDTLQTLVGFVRRQYPVIAFILLLAIALTTIYLVNALPEFSSDARLLIDVQKTQIFSKDLYSGDTPFDITPEVESQVEVLKSSTIASGVIEKLELIREDEFGGPEGALPRAVKAFQSRLSVSRVGSTRVIQISFKSSDADRAARIVNEIAETYMNDQLEAKYQVTKRASKWLQDRLAELHDQVSQAEQKVVIFKTTNNIVSTGEGDKTHSLASQQVAELSSQLVLAQANTAQAQARLNRIDSLLKGAASNNDGLPGVSVGDMSSDKDWKGEVASNLRARYRDLAAREADWSAKYGSGHIAVVNLRNQMQETRNAILDEIKRLAATSRNEYEISKQREAAAQQDLAKAISQSQEIDAKLVTLRELQSTAQTYKTLYENFLQHYTESVQQQSFPIPQARLISPASRPLQNDFMKKVLTLAIGSLGGLILGIGIGLLRDLSDRVFRTSEQVEGLLQTDCIALVPLLTRSHEGRRSLLSRFLKAVRSSVLVSDLHESIKSTKDKTEAFTGSPFHKETKPVALVPGPVSGSSVSREIVHDDDVCWTVVNKPLSRFSEAVRSIKVAVDLSGAVGTSRVFGLTSALPDEGKSTLAVSTAQLMSMVSGRTILVDCDLRNPALSRALAPNATAGLMHLVLGRLPLEEIVWKDPSTNMSFLPIVTKNRPAHSSEILGSPQFKKVFEKLRENYDYIIVDLPPLEPIVDVRATTNFIDSYILVVEWGRVKIDVVKHTLHRARGVHDNLLGVVLNKVDMNIFGRYASVGESYYDERYSRYGYTEE